jgi:acyl transferase domain-containing protein/phospholipid N-methyltransferase
MIQQTTIPSSQDILEALDKAVKKIETLEGQLNEPIAIIGLSSRFPGADDPDASTEQRHEAFWQLLRDGVDAISEIPGNRWDVEAFYSPDRDDKTKMYTRQMGAITKVADFDAQFFGISPREAERIDPQQRLLLETCWEALEHAGQAADKLRKSKTGVFMGVCNNDYALLNGADHSTTQDYLLNLGIDNSIAVGRISHILGLQGPALCVNTTCSTSLVTIHLACQSLRNRESNVALAGGVNLILSPQSTISGCRHNALALDGHCKTFDASADGYVRGEGCGVVVLKRLQDAVASGDNILAVIRGSAVNHDGASSGLTTPNERAQEQLLGEALKNAKIQPDDLSYIEAHGTGTALGDPIEIGALGTVFGKRTTPLWVGSVKTNIGHLEGAGGVAGLIKVVLMLQHGEIPPHLHFNTPSPHIDWQALSIKIPTKANPWPAPRIAGVSAFGFSGTNAHIVLSEAPLRNTPGTGSEVERAWHLLTLSAKTEQALTNLVRRYQAFLNTTDAPLVDICYTANTGRNHFAHRFALWATSRHEMQAHLATYNQGEHQQGGIQGYAPAYQRMPKIAFLFTGQGSQYIGMGRQLYASEPTFRQTLKQCDEYLRQFDIPLLSILYPESEEARINQTTYTQPALFALEYALTRLWQSWGIEPDSVMGHSVGEYVAACVAGIFSLEDALKLIAARGRLMGALPEDGAMVAVMANEQLVEQALAPIAAEVSIAAINGPENVVISGKREAVIAITEQLAATGVKTRQITVSHAFHSPLMEPMLDEFRRVAATITYRKPKLPFVTNITGKVASDDVTTPEYWVRHVRETVRFAAGMNTLAALGIDIFMEIGPKPTLLAMAKMAFEAANISYLTSLREDQNDSQQMFTSLGELYVRGVQVDWDHFANDKQRRKVVLPTYPFQRKRYWLENSMPAAAMDKRLSRLIDRLIQLPRQKETIYETNFSVARLPFLTDHVIFGKMVSSGTCQLATTLEAAHLAYPQQTLQLVDVVLPQALVFADEQDERTVQVVFSSESSSNPGAIPFELISFQAQQANDTLRTHASGTLRVTPRLAPTVDIAAAQSRCLETLDFKRIEAYWEASQFQFGPCYLWLDKIWYGQGEVIGRLLLPEAVNPVDAHQLHPGLLDASLHLILAFRLSEKEVADLRNQRETRLPFGFDAVTLYGKLTTNAEWWCYAQLLDGQRWRVQLLDAAGSVFVQIEGINERPASPQHVLGAEAWCDWLYQVEWQRRPTFGLAPDYLPSPATIAPLLFSSAPAFWTELNGDKYENLLAALEEVSLEYVLAALASADRESTGLDFQPGERWHRSQLVQQIGGLPSYQRLVTRLLAMLVEAEYLTPTQDGWQVVKTPGVVNPAEHVATLQRRFGHSLEVTLLARCGEKLLEVLRGEQKPLELLFPGGDTTLVSQLNTSSPSAQVMNRLVQQVIENALRSLPQERGLRILEIGAGTGGTTAGVLPLLPVAQTDYLFTDIGPAFLHQAQARFADYSFVRYQPLDIEKSPTEQGFIRQQTDLIIATNVLHATKNLTETLTNVRQLLQRGGQLVLVEATRRRRWIDLTFGLTDGWWRFADERHDHPLLTAAEWKTRLLENGFATVETIEQGGQAVIIAQADTNNEPAAKPAKVWLIFADAHGVGEALANQLQQRGETPLLIYAGMHYQQRDARSISIRPDHASDYQRLLGSVDGIHTITHLWSLDTAPLQDGIDVVDASQQGCGTVLHLVQALLHQHIEPAAFYLITADTQAVTKMDATVGVVQSALWGMGKVIALEHPELNCVQIDLEATSSINGQAALLYAEATPLVSDQPQEEQVALRHDGRYVARLMRYKVEPEMVSPTPSIEAEATYLITGGLGGLGLVIAQWLAEQGARHLLLVGRSPPKSEVQPHLDRLAEMGVTVTVAQADVAVLAQLQAALDQVDKRYPLRGVIHSVGVLDDGVLLQQSWSRFEKVMAPKMQGAWHLHQLTQKMPLDFFVLFSSGTSLLGNRGQANHAAANAFLDALAHYRQTQGLPALSINWGGWSEIGAAASMVRSGQMAARGYGEITPQQGIRAFAHLLGQNAPQVGVIPIHWTKFLRTTNSPFYQAFKQLEAHAATSKSAQQTLFVDIRQQLASALESERHALLVQYLRATVAKVLRLEPELLDPHQGLVEMGLDSLMAIELRNQVQKELAIELPVIIYLDNSSIAQLAEQILGSYMGTTTSSQRVVNAKDDSVTLGHQTTPTTTRKTRVRL